MTDRSHTSRKRLAIPLLLLATVWLALTVEAKAGARLDLSTEKRAAQFLEASAIPVSGIPGICSQVAGDYPTLGRLVAFHRAHANVKNYVRCKRAVHRWICEAEFIYNNKKEEDDGWYLTLNYSVDGESRIVDLECVTGP
jgi:hypothetical protein